MLRAYLFVVAVVVTFGAYAQEGQQSRIREFETELQQGLKPGLPQSAAERFLESWNVSYRFVSADQFSGNTLISVPPKDSIGALIGTTKPLEKRLFESFVYVVVFIDREGNISKVASKALTSGP